MSPGIAVKPAQSMVAEEVGMKAANEVAMAVFDVRRRLQVYLRQVVAEIIDGPQEAEAEYRELLETLRRG